MNLLFIKTVQLTKNLSTTFGDKFCIFEHFTLRLFTYWFYNIILSIFSHSESNTTRCSTLLQDKESDGRCGDRFKCFHLQPKLYGKIVTICYYSLIHDIAMISATNLKLACRFPSLRYCDNDLIDY